MAICADQCRHCATRQTALGTDRIEAHSRKKARCAVSWVYSSKLANQIRINNHPVHFNVDFNLNQDLFMKSLQILVRDCSTNNYTHDNLVIMVMRQFA